MRENRVSRRKYELALRALREAGLLEKGKGRIVRLRF